MKIVHMIPGLTVERGGPSTVIQSLTRQQAEAGDHVTVVTTDQGMRSGETPSPLDPRVDLAIYPVIGPDRLAYSPKLVSALPDLTRQSDVVHVHSIFTFPVHATVRAAWRADKRILLRPCGLLHPYSLKRSALIKSTYLRIWGAWLQQAITAWHFTSEDESLQSWPPTAQHRYVVPNGIDVPPHVVERQHARQLINHLHPQSDGAPFFLFLSRIHPKKRLDLLIPSFLKGAPKHYRLVIAGPDESSLLSPLMSRAAAEFGEQAVGRIQVLGQVHGDLKWNLLAGAEALVLPSEHENFGNVVLESLAVNTPAVTSQYVDIMKPVVQATLGETIALDLESWTNWFSTAEHRLPELHLAASSAARWVEHNYSWKYVAEKLKTIYACGLVNCETG